MIRRSWLLWLPPLLAIAAHSSALLGGFTNWDDPHYLLRNPMTEHPLGLGWLELLLTRDLHYPIPVTMLGYAAQRSVFGLDPAMFHLVSLLIHAGVVALVVGLARRLGASIAGATIAASIYAVHPLCVEPVAWVTGQKELWCALFLLSAVFVRAREGDPSRWRNAAVIALCCVAMLSKPTAVCAVALVVAVDWARGRRLRRHLITYGLLLAGATLVTALSIWGHERIASGPTAHFGVDSLLRAAWVVKLQVTHAVVPIGLGAMYFAPSGFELALGVGAGLLVTAALVGSFAWGARRGHRMLAAGVLAALAAYAPTSGLVPIARGAADSYMYLPLALAAAFAATAAGRAFITWRRNTAVAAALVVALLGGLSFAQHRFWRDGVVLWYRVVDLNPDEKEPLYHLAAGFLSMRQPGPALEVFELLESEYPDYLSPKNSHANTLLALDRIAEAEPRFAAACREGDIRALADYATFLIRHDIEPTDPEAAKAALLLAAPLLADHARVTAAELERAARRLGGYGYAEAAALVERRLARKTGS